ncbi:MAG: LysR family transcriptional regulator [Proteobacteria bacterium]|nr:LysR family transcriptional regulator [Pseudomonadota bacterium]
MSLSFRQLQVVRAVCRHGSVIGAASALGISQPAVSMMLRDCTRAAGFPLFLRKQGRLQPTMETSALMTDLDRIFDGVERVGRLLEDMRDTKVGMIQIAATPTLAENLLPPAVTAFKQSRPRVQITIHSMDNISVVNSVINEHVDFGLVLSPLAPFDAQLFELCSAELVCVVHPDNPLAARSEVTPKDLEAYPLISFSRSLPLGVLVEKTFREAGVPRRITLEVNQSSVACALARAGAGVAIVDPFWLMENRDHGLVRIKVKPRTQVVAQVLVPKNATLSRPTRIMIAELRKVAKRARL